MTSCAFTGHRRLSGTEEAELFPLLLRGIAYLYEKGVRDFYAGGAYGFDLLAEESVLSFREMHPDVRLHLLLPHRGQENRWTARNIARYRAACRAADSSVYLAESYYPGVMRSRNQALIEKADACIAYLVTGGGTAQTVAMARKKGIPIFNLAKEVSAVHEEL